MSYRRSNHSLRCRLALSPAILRGGCATVSATIRGGLAKFCGELWRTFELQARKLTEFFEVCRSLSETREQMIWKGSMEKKERAESAAQWC